MNLELFKAIFSELGLWAGTFTLVLSYPGEIANAGVFWDQKKSASRTALVYTYQRFAKSDSLPAILDDPELSMQLKALLGEDLQLYLKAAQINELPQYKNDEFYARGVSNLGDCESFFNLNLKSKKLNVLVYKDGRLCVYGPANPDEFSFAVDEYIEDLKSRREVLECIYVRSALSDGAIQSEDRARTF